MNLIATLRKPLFFAALLAVAAGAPRPADAQTPNDPRYPQQTYFETIDVEGAWAVTTGDPGQKIAIIGTGSVLPTHEDLDAKVSLESRGTYDDGDYT